MTRYTKIRSVGIAVALAATGVMAFAGTASAEESSASATISAGKENVAIGTATFTRTTTSSGETLTVHLSVAQGIDQSSICLSDEPFTKRVAPGGCKDQQDATGTVADYQIDLGTAYIGEPLYVQAHVASGEETGFAGWLEGKPFFGSVRIAAVVGAELPIGALGGAGVALLSGAALAVVSLRRRATTRSI